MASLSCFRAGGAARRLPLVRAGLGYRGGHRGHLLLAVWWALVCDHAIGRY